MSDAPVIPEQPPADPHAGHGAWARGVVERHVAVQEQLAQAGLRLAEEAWAIEEIASGTEASPFNRMKRPRPPPLAGEVARRAGGGLTGRRL
jgi:hypothetical protein